MKCKDCNACQLGYFKSKPNSYVCIGVKVPFVIEDINAECTEYESKNSGIKKTLLEHSCKDNDVIKHIESLGDRLNRIRVVILNETTRFCEECPSREDCPKEECVLYRIEQIIEIMT